MVAVERRPVLGHQELHDRDGLLESLHPLWSGREVDAQLDMLFLVPRRADRQLDAPMRDVVGGHDLRREDRGMAVSNAGDERAEPDRLGHGRQPRQQRPPLQARTRRIPVKRLEVVEDPRAVEPGGFGVQHALFELVPGQLMLRTVESDLDHASHLPRQMDPFNQPATSAPSLSYLAQKK